MENMLKDDICLKQMPDLVLNNNRKENLNILNGMPFVSKHQSVYQSSLCESSKRLHAYELYKHIQ